MAVPWSENNGVVKIMGHILSDLQTGDRFTWNQDQIAVFTDMLTNDPLWLAFYEESPGMTDKKLAEFFTENWIHEYLLHRLHFKGLKKPQWSDKRKMVNTKILRKLSTLVKGLMNEAAAGSQDGTAPPPKEQVEPNQPRASPSSKHKARARGKKTVQVLDSSENSEDSENANYFASQDDDVSMGGLSPPRDLPQMYSGVSGQSSGGAASRRGEELRNLACSSSSNPLGKVEERIVSKKHLPKSRTGGPAQSDGVHDLSGADDELQEDSGDEKLTPAEIAAYAQLRSAQAKATQQKKDRAAKADKVKKADRAHLERTRIEAAQKKMEEIEMQQALKEEEELGQITTTKNLDKKAKARLRLEHEISQTMRILRRGSILMLLIILEKQARRRQQKT